MEEHQGARTINQLGHNVEITIEELLNEQHQMAIGGNVRRTMNSDLVLAKVQDLIVRELGGLPKMREEEKKKRVEKENKQDHARREHHDRGPLHATQEKGRDEMAETPDGKKGKQ